MCSTSFKLLGKLKVNTKTITTHFKGRNICYWWPLRLLAPGPKNLALPLSKYVSTGNPHISTETVRTQSCMYVQSQTVLSYCFYVTIF
jgi:hypothetical protein